MVLYGTVWYGAPLTPWAAIVATRWWQLDRAQDKEKWRKLAARLPLAPVETKPISEQARTPGRNANAGNGL
jgi:hypothetical protein